MSDSYKHITVLLNEAVDALVQSPSGIYVDCTFGRGGHSALVLEMLNEEGQLIAIDKDPEAIAFAHQRFADPHLLCCALQSGIQWCQFRRAE